MMVGLLLGLYGCGSAPTEGTPDAGRDAAHHLEGVLSTMDDGSGSHPRQRLHATASCLDSAGCKPVEAEPLTVRRGYFQPTGR